MKIKDSGNHHPENHQNPLEVKADPSKMIVRPPELDEVLNPYFKIRRSVPFKNITSWWFQPIWKILVKLEIFPNLGWT